MSFDRVFSKMGNDGMRRITFSNYICYPKYDDGIPCDIVPLCVLPKGNDGIPSDRVCFPIAMMA